MARKCTRQGCVHEATATLSYQYSRSLVWMDDLSPERDPHSYDLCEQHADRLRPPSGWHLEDRRHRIHVVESDDETGLPDDGFLDDTLFQPGRLAAG